MGSSFSRSSTPKAQNYNDELEKSTSYPASMTTLPDSRQTQRTIQETQDLKNSKTQKPKKAKKLNKPSKNCTVIGGHEKAINCIAIDQNNALLLTGSDDHTAQIWELSTGEKLSDLTGHEGYITAVAFEENEDIYALTASTDKTVKRWGPLPMNTDEVRTFRPHKSGKINHIEVLGSIVFTASYDGTIMATEMISGMTIRSFLGHRHSVTTMILINTRVSSKNSNYSIEEEMTLEEALDQKTKNWVSNQTSINQVFDEQLITCSADWTCRIWDVKTAKSLYTLKGHSGAVMAMCVDKEQVHVFTASKDSTIRKWNIRSGHCLHIYEGHEGSVTKILLDYEGQNNGSFLYSSSMDGTVKSWSTIHGTNLRTYRCQTIVSTFLKLKDLICVFCGDCTLKVFYSRDGKMLGESKSSNSMIRHAVSTQGNQSTAAAKKTQLYSKNQVNLSIFIEIFF